MQCRSKRKTETETTVGPPKKQRKHKGQEGEGGGEAQDKPTGNNRAKPVPKAATSKNTKFGENMKGINNWLLKYLKPNQHNTLNSFLS